MSSFQGKVALVTGAAQGIGRAIAVAFARGGADVVATDLDDTHAKSLQNELARTDARWQYVTVDVATPEGCARIVHAALDRFGRLDCAVNNAGISEGPPPKPLADYPADLWDRVIGVNLSGVFWCMQHELRAMLGGGRGGAIVNIASVAGQIAFPGVAGYVASKHGVVGLTKVAALDYGKQGIRCNAIGPGFIETRMLPSESREWMRSVTPQGRLGTVEEIAQTTLWLCSESSSFVNGAYLAVDGGFLAQ